MTRGPFISKEPSQVKDWRFGARRWCTPSDRRGADFRSPGHPRTDRSCIRCAAARYCSVRGPFGNAWPVGSGPAERRDRHSEISLRPALYEILRHRTDYGEVASLRRANSRSWFGAELKLYRRRTPPVSNIAARRCRKRLARQGRGVPKLVAGSRFNPSWATGAHRQFPEIMMRFWPRHPSGAPRFPMEQNVSAEWATVKSSSGPRSSAARRYPLRDLSSRHSCR